MIRFKSVETVSITTISIAGKLEAYHLAELESLYAKARPAVVFDLAQLQSADEASIRWLCDHVKEGYRVTGASPYIGLRLERELGDRGHPASAVRRGPGD